MLAEVCLQAGQRSFIGKVVMDDPEQCPDDYRDASTAQAIDETERFIDFVRDRASSDWKNSEKGQLHPGKNLIREKPGGPTLKHSARS